MIDRYSLSSPYEDSEMVGDPDGDWVEYEEYAKLLEMYQHLTAAVKEVQSRRGKSVIFGVRWEDQE